jgi:lactate permease
VILTPFILVFLTGKSKNSLKGVGLITLISGLSFLIPEYLVAKFLGAELPVVIGSVCSMLCTIGVARIFAKKEANPEFCIEGKSQEKVTGKEGLIAWSSFILIFIFLLEPPS